MRKEELEYKRMIDEIEREEQELHDKEMAWELEMEQMMKEEEAFEKMLAEEDAKFEEMINKIME